MAGRPATSGPIGSYNPVPGPVGGAQAPPPGSGSQIFNPFDPNSGSSQQGVRPNDWASIYDAQGLYGGRGKPTGSVSGMIGSGTPTADMSLPDQNAPSESYSWSTGGSSSGGSGSGGSGGGSGPGGASNGSGASQIGRGSLAGLQSLVGGGSGGSGGGMGAGGLSAGGAASFDDIGAPAMASTAIDSTAVTAPTSQSAMPPDMAGGQMLSGPTMGRQGLGQRVPPSLAAMLKVRAY